VTDAVSSQTQYRWFHCRDLGLLREPIPPDGGRSWRCEAWIDIAGPPLWHWIPEIAGYVASEIDEGTARGIIAHRGNGDLYEADRSAQYDREVFELDDRHGTEELPPAEPFGSMSEAGRERYVQARREGLSFDDALALGRGHVMHGPVPPTLMPHDDSDGDADDR